MSAIDSVVVGTAYIVPSCETTPVKVSLMRSERTFWYSPSGAAVPSSMAVARRS